MSYFILKNAEDKTIGVLSTDGIVTATIEFNELTIKYSNMRVETCFNVADVVNLDDFFTMLSVDSYKSYGDSVGCDEDKAETLQANKYHRYHAIFHENSAKIIPLENLHTLFVKPNEILYTTMQDSGVYKVPYQVYNNLFEKLKSYNSFYVIEDVIAIYAYGIAELNMRLTEEGLYNLSIRYNNQTGNSNYLLNIDDDRAIHLLNTISNL